jgi:class 3 adenylate cyclase
MKELLGCEDGEKTTALVCFTDIAGFARRAETLSLESIAGLLKRVGSIISRCMRSTAGQVVKYIGDSSLLVFPEDDTERSVRELLTMKREIEEYFSSDHPQLAITFSAHVGEIIAVRLEPIEAMDVLGNTVSTASILGRRARAGDFVISHAVYEKLGEDTRAEFLRHEPLPVYVAGSERPGP